MYMDCVKAFIEDHPDYPLPRRTILLPRRQRPCVWPKVWLLGFCVDPTTDDSTYFVNFFVCWFCGDVSPSFMHSIVMILGVLYDDPSKLFSFWIRSLADPTGLMGPSPKDNEGRCTNSLRDFSYLVTCHLNVPVYQHVLYIVVKVYCPTHFLHQLGYNQHFSSSLTSQLSRRLPLWDVNVFQRQCMHCLTSFTLVVHFIYLRKGLSFAMHSSEHESPESFARALIFFTCHHWRKRRRVISLQLEHLPLIVERIGVGRSIK